MRLLLPYDDALRDLVEELERWLPYLPDLNVPRERKAHLLSAFQQARTLRDKHGEALAGELGLVEDA